MPDSLRPLSFLLVDDEEDHRELISQMLVDTGLRHHVTQAKNVAEAALALESGEDFDLMLMDHRLGSSDSREILSRGPNLPIVILTAFARDDLDDELMHMGATDFVSKADLNPSLLRRTIKHALERYNQIQTLREQSEKDALTGLYNRRYLDEALARELHQINRDKSPGALCLIDMDNLKPINDTYGHPTGDRALQHLASAILACARRNDICARVGGDEFCVLFLGTDVEDAIVFIERIRDYLNQHPFPGYPHTLSASFGLSALTVSQTPTQAFKAADEALYEAKHAGRNTVVCKR